MDRVFYFDFDRPEAYLLAEEMVQAEWVPVRGGEIDARAPTLDGVADAVAQRRMQRLRAPDPFPFDTELALRAATYAATIGKVVAFTLAAFRQAYAGGRSLASADNVVIAAAACEMHPRAVLQAIERDSIAQRLEAATALARERVATVPSIWSQEEPAR